MSSSFMDVSIFPSKGFQGDPIEWKNSYKYELGFDCWKLALKEATETHGEIWDKVIVTRRPCGYWGESKTFHSNRVTKFSLD